MLKRILLLCLLLQTTLAFADDGWKLSAEKDGIKIYTRPVANSNIRAVRVDCSLPVRQAQLVYVILDIDHCHDWLYHNKLCKLVKRVSPFDLYYYAEVNAPWPAQNRDYITHLMVSQNAKTKIVTIDAFSAPDMLPVKPNIVRVTHSVDKWTIYPYENNAIKVSYELEVDPSGSVPVWLVNLFATQGPMETFQRLKIQLQKKEYKERNRLTKRERAL